MNNKLNIYTVELTAKATLGNDSVETRKTVVVQAATMQRAQLAAVWDLAELIYPSAQAEEERSDE